MQRFTPFFGSPIGSCQIIIIIISLPDKRWICRLTHPNHDSRSIIPHFTAPGFEHRFIGLEIYQLSFLTKILNTFRLPILFNNGMLIDIWSAVFCQRAKEMFIPHFRTRPPRIFRHEFFKTFKCRENGSSDFAAKSPTTIFRIFVSQNAVTRICKVEFRCIILP